MRQEIQKQFGLSSAQAGGAWLEESFGAYVKGLRIIVSRCECGEGQNGFTSVQAITGLDLGWTCEACGQVHPEPPLADAGKIRRRLEEYLRRHPVDAIALAARLGLDLFE